MAAGTRTPGCGPLSLRSLHRSQVRCVIRKGSPQKSPLGTAPPSKLPRDPPGGLHVRLPASAKGGASRPPRPPPSTQAALGRHRPPPDHAGAWATGSGMTQSLNPLASPRLRGFGCSFGQQVREQRQAPRGAGSPRRGATPEPRDCHPKPEADASPLKCPWPPRLDPKAARPFQGPQSHHWGAGVTFQKTRDHCLCSGMAGDTVTHWAVG